MSQASDSGEYKELKAKLEELQNEYIDNAGRLKSAVLEALYIGPDGEVVDSPGVGIFELRQGVLEGYDITLYDLSGDLTGPNLATINGALSRHLLRHDPVGMIADIRRTSQGELGVFDIGKLGMTLNPRFKYPIIVSDPSDVLFNMFVRFVLGIRFGKKNTRVVYNVRDAIELAFGGSSLEKPSDLGMEGTGTS